MTDTALRDALAAQIRSQYGGSGTGSGNWDDAGFDRAAELADLLLAQGVTSLGDLSFVDTPWSKDHAAIAAEYGEGAQDGREAFTETGVNRQLRIGDTTVGYLGDYNNDGTFGNKSAEYLQTHNLGSDREENLLGWSARGDGNTSYRVITDPNTGKLVITPGWNSSSDAEAARKAAITMGIVAGGALLAPGAGAGAGAAGHGAWLGEGVASGIPAWDAAYTGAGGLLSGAGGAAAGSGAWIGEGVASGVPEWDAAYTAAQAGGAASGGGSLLDTLKNGASTAGNFIADNPKLIGAIAGGVLPLLDGDDDDGGGGGDPYTGPMPDITRGDWQARVTPQYMQIPTFGGEMATNRHANSGLWRYGGQANAALAQPPAPQQQMPQAAPQAMPQQQMPQSVNPYQPAPQQAPGLLGGAQQQQAMPTGLLSPQAQPTAVPGPQTYGTKGLTQDAAFSAFGDLRSKGFTNANDLYGYMQRDHGLNFSETYPLYQQYMQQTGQAPAQTQSQYGPANPTAPVAPQQYGGNTSQLEQAIAASLGQGFSIADAKKGAFEKYGVNQDQWNAINWGNVPGGSTGPR